MLNTFHLEAGVRLLLTGVLIILIVSIVPRERTS
jgi:ribose transport system permease protein